MVGAEMRLALVLGIRDAGSAIFEKSWVEWKTHVDLAGKRWQAEIAKQIIGFANRMPEAAERYAGGHGYLVLGAEPGLVDEVTAVEDLQFVRDVRPYLGEAGPVWDSNYVEVAGMHVLVVDVHPPKWGDPVHQVRKELAGEVRQGVYVRGIGETATATASELDQLVDRARRGAVRIAVDVTWRNGGPTIDPIQLSDIALERWIAQERVRIDPPQRTVRPSLAMQATMLNSIFASETRDRQAFEQERDSFLKQARKLLPIKAMVQGAWAQVGVARLKAVNSTERHLKDVRVEVMLPEGARAILDPHDEELLLDFPEAPKAWGTARPFDTIFHNPYLGPTTGRPTLGWVDSTRRVVTFAEKDIYPEDWVGLPPLHILVGEDLAGQTLELQWSARASSVDGVVRGRLTFGASKTIHPLDKLMSYDRLVSYNRQADQEEE